MSGRDEVVIHTILGGRVRLDRGQDSHRYQLGDADIDITIADIADIARAAGVTVRAVQLDQAHRQLQVADPDRDSVTAVAYRWGFSSPGRFAAYYRRAYGVPPSRTLRN